MSNELHSDTGTWVRKLHDTQEKDEKNREHQGENHKGKKLPSKRHLKGN